MLSNQGLTKRDFRAALGFIRLAESSFTAVAYAWAGLYSVESLNLIPYIVPSIAIGVPIGAAIIQRIRPETFRRICMSFDAWIVGFGLSNLLKELRVVDSNLAFLVLRRRRHSRYVAALSLLHRAAANGEACGGARANASRADCGIAVKLHTKLLLALVAGFAAGRSRTHTASRPAIDFLGTQILAPIGQIFLRTHPHDRGADGVRGARHWRLRARDGSTGLAASPAGRCCSRCCSAPPRSRSACCW